MPGWPVYVFISGAGHVYHREVFCPALMRGQRKAEARGQVVRSMRAIGVREAEELGRRACRWCIAVPRTRSIRTNGSPGA